MKSKRKLFALFIMIFALYGCAGTKAMETETSLFQTYSKDMAANANTSSRMRVETVTEETLTSQPELIYRDYEGNGGISWIASLVDQGTPGKVQEDYYVTKDFNGNIVSKTKVLGSQRSEDARPAVMQFGGSVTPGSVFFPKTTTYGVDCVGCSGETTGSGGTATGIRLDVNLGVRQSNGSWQQGITYDGYYIVAADKNIPLGSIIEISDHGYSGAGLTPGVPFYAMVLDRGGGIYNNHLDLYAGSEKQGTLSINSSMHHPKATIVSVGGN